MRCPSCGYRNPDQFRFCGKCGSSLVGEPILEKRWATILFYDVSGYSRFAREHDLEETHRQLDDLLRHCRYCVQLHGGQIDKFFGDGMLAVFGASNSRENEPLKALKAAVCMVKRSRQETLRGRAGIATGMVMLGPLGGEESAHQTVIGDAVNLAQRMVSSAPAGSIWLDETTSRLIPEAKLDEVGARKFKGFEERIRVWRFKDWSGKPEPLFGRRLELERLLGFLDRTAAGKGGVVTIAGPLGIGKSFLVEEALRLRAGRIRSVSIPKLDVSDPVRNRLRATFYENFGPHPMDYLESLGLGEIDRRLLAYALGLESERPAPISELESALVGTMRRTLALVARDKPLVIVAHTGPRDHTLVRTMIKSIGESPIPGLLVVVLRRQPEEGADIVLGPLPWRDADAYIRHLNPAMDDAGRRRIYQEAKGNPLQIRLLALSGDPAVSVMAAFQSRLDKLPASHRQTLLYAALGRPASWFGVLLDLVGERAREAVSNLINDGYLVADGDALGLESRLEVSNPLLQQVAESILPADERRRAHRGYWAWLKRQEEQRLAAVAAEHALLAGLPNEAARAWIAAGDYQRDYGIFTGAESYYRRALEAAGEEVRLTALRRLAELYLQADSASEAIEVLRGVEEQWALRLRGLALAMLRKSQAAEQLLGAALEINPGDAQVELALISLRSPRERLAGLRALKRNLEGKSQHLHVLPYVNLRLAETLAEHLRLDEAVPVMREAYKGFVAQSNGSRAAGAALAIAGYMWRVEKLAAAAEWADKAIEHGRRAHPGVATIAWSVRAGLWLDQGRPAEAEEALKKAEVNMEHARNDEERARIHAIRIRFLVETGRLSQALNLGEAVFSGLPHSWIAANLALVHALRGGHVSEERQRELDDRFFEVASPPGKVLFFLARAIREWRNGGQPKPLLKRALRLGKLAGPYLRYLTLILMNIYLLDENPQKALSLAQYLQRRSSSGGFSAVNQTARLIRAELALVKGEPVAHLLRFETSLGPQEVWQRSLRARAGMEVLGNTPPSLSGYGILGAWARLAWREAVHAKQDGSSRRNP